MQIVRRMATLPGLRVSEAHCGDRLILSNGHARPVVLSENMSWLCGMLPPPTAPTATVEGAGSGTVNGTWQFFVQYWSGTTKRGSNLSPGSNIVYCVEGADGANNQVTVNFSGLVTAFPTYSNGVFLNMMDRVRIWALRHLTKELKMVSEVALEDGSYVFDMPTASFDGIIGEDRVADIYGDTSEPVSIGLDIFPSCKFIAWYPEAQRLLGLFQENYSHPGRITITSSPSLTYAGKPRARVDLAPYPVNGTNYGTSTPGHFWEYSIPGSVPDTYIGVGPNNECLWFVIHGNAVAKITKDGVLYLKGSLVWKDSGLPHSGLIKSNPIEYDPQREAILVCMDYTSTWFSALVFRRNGNLEFEVKTPEPLATGGGVLVPSEDPIATRAGGVATDSSIGFLPKDIEYYPPWYGAQLGWIWHGTTECAELVSMTGQIVENATDEELGIAPMFDQGLIHKQFIWRGKFIDTIYDVVTDRRLWLAAEYKGESITYDPLWEVKGNPYLFYSGYGCPEGGCFSKAFRQEGKGSFFDFRGLTATGLSISPYGAELMFKEGEYLLRIWGTETPLLPESYELTRRMTKTATFAPRSIARDKDNARLSLAIKPKGIAYAQGGHMTMLTDIAGCRRSLEKEIDPASMADACATYWSAHNGDHYVVMNLSSADRAGQYDHGILMSLRDKPHLTYLDFMQASALGTIVDDLGNHNVMYADRSGRVGVLFEQILGMTLDNWESIPWYVALFFSPLDLQPVSLTGLRVFATLPIKPVAQANWPTESYEPCEIGCDIYPLKRFVQEDDLFGFLGRYWQEYRLLFKMKDETAEAHLTPHKALTAPAFIIELYGGPMEELVGSEHSQDFQVKLKGLEIDWQPAGDVRAVR